MFLLLLAFASILCASDCYSFEQYTEDHDNPQQTHFVTSEIDKELTTAAAVVLVDMTEKETSASIKAEGTEEEPFTDTVDENLNAGGTPISFGIEEPTERVWTAPNDQESSIEDTTSPDGLEQKIQEVDEESNADGKPSSSGTEEQTETIWTAPKDQESSVEDTPSPDGLEEKIQEVDKESNADGKQSSFGTEEPTQTVWTAQIDQESRVKDTPLPDGVKETAEKAWTTTTDEKLNIEENLPSTKLDETKKVLNAAENEDLSKERNDSISSQDTLNGDPSGQDKNKYLKENTGTVEKKRGGIVPEVTDTANEMEINKTIITTDESKPDQSSGANIIIGIVIVIIVIGAASFGYKYYKKRMDRLNKNNDSDDEAGGEELREIVTARGNGTTKRKEEEPLVVQQNMEENNRDTAVRTTT